MVIVSLFPNQLRNSLIIPKKSRKTLHNSPKIGPFVDQTLSALPMNLTPQIIMHKSAPRNSHKNRMEKNLQDSDKLDHIHLLSSMNSPNQYYNSDSEHQPEYSGYLEEDQFFRLDNRKNSEIISRKHSTACHSAYSLNSEEDQNNNNNLFAPSSLFQRKKQNSLKIDLREDINHILEKQSSSINSVQDITSMNSQFTVKCALGHTYDTTFTKLRLLTRKFAQFSACQNSQFEDDIIEEEEGINNNNESSRIFCFKCQPKFTEAQKYAHQQKGQLLSEAFVPQLQFSCERGHEFNLSHTTYSKRWCSLCKKLLKQEFKDFLKSEEEKRQKIYEEKQQELYRNARQKYKQSYQEDSDYSSDSHSQQNHSNDPKSAKKIIQAAQVVEKQLQQLAKNKAEQYLQENPESSVSELEAIEVYKMILFPEQILECFLEALDRIALKKQYRDYARHIHPDKNHHPESSHAFQKLNAIYQKVNKKQISSQN